MTDILLLTFLFLVAGLVAVPIATMLGLGSVLGFLIAGIAISPLLAALNVDVVSLQHFAEFGVVMMLFLVGLELEPRLLWSMRHRLLGLGGLQVALTALVIMAAAMALGQVWTVALAIGLVFALSSTAIVLQTLGEKGLQKSDGGQGSFSVLLFQDIAVIPMLALIPLLALPELVDLSHSTAQVAEGSHAAGPLFIETLPGWQRALVTLVAVGAVIGAGSFLTSPIFRFISKAKLRELFVAAALGIVVGIALLMSLVGLSPALGTFLAGVALANSEYRHELESDIEPFKGLLLGLFFMTVGAGINFALLFDSVAMVLGLTIGVIAIKCAVLYVLGLVFKIRGADRWLFALGLAQAGEFGFVLLGFTVTNSVIPQATADVLLLVVALSMLFTPALFILYDRVIAPRYSAYQDREADEIAETGTIVIAGHGRFGGVVNRILRGGGYTTVVLDHSSAQLEMLSTFGLRAYFGDATRPDLLHAAGIAKAKMLVVAIDDREKATQLVHYVHHNHPHVYIVARATDRNHVYELYAAGCRDIIRETFDSSVRAGRSALQALGMHAYEAEKLVRDFEIADREAIRALATPYNSDIPIHENTPYVAKARELLEAQEAEMKRGRTGFASRSERGWVPPRETPLPVKPLNDEG